MAAWPPLFLPETPPRLPAIRGFLPNPSLDGGLLLLELSLPSRRSRSATLLRQRSILPAQLRNVSLKPLNQRADRGAFRCTKARIL